MYVMVIVMSGLRYLAETDPNMVVGLVPPPSPGSSTMTGVSMMSRAPGAGRHSLGATTATKSGPRSTPSASPM